MAADGKIDGRALLGLLRSWLFNYNSVEAIMIFSAVIVSLMGIMYSAQARASAYYGEARDAVTAVVLFVVIVSIIYFVTVMVVEITTLASEANRRKLMTKRSALKRKGLDDDENRKKDREARASVIQSDILAAPVDSMNNPLFTSGKAGAVSSASVHETIMGATTSPSMDLWRLFQNSFSGLQNELESVSKQLAEAKVQQQKLDQAQAMLAEAGITVQLGAAPTNIRKARQEFGPTTTGDAPTSPGSGGRLGMSRMKSLGNFNAKSTATVGKSSVALKSLRTGKDKPLADKADDEN